MKAIYKGVVGLLILILVAASAYGAPFSENFQNDYTVDAVYLFITSGDVTFLDLLTEPPGWTYTVEDKKLVVTGGTIAPYAGDFEVLFSDRASFDMEWAELLGGTIQGAGTLNFNGGGHITGASSAFTSAVPIPQTYWLLGSGLICFVGIRRKIAA